MKVNAMRKLRAIRKQLANHYYAVNRAASPEYLLDAEEVEKLRAEQERLEAELEDSAGKCEVKDV